VAQLRLQQPFYHPCGDLVGDRRLPAFAGSIAAFLNSGREALLTASSAFPSENVIMRALCGSIITAGALIGLGLAALGIGTRYAGPSFRDVNGNILPLRFHEMDTPLSVALVILILAVLVGLGIAFVGLAYHHERRHRERLHMHHEGTTGTHIPV
jgi:hypothetical protein